MRLNAALGVSASNEQIVYALMPLKITGTSSMITTKMISHVGFIIRKEMLVSS
jgi:hypothetical protein